MKHLYKILISMYLTTALAAAAQTGGASPAFALASQPSQPVSAQAGESQFKGSLDVLELMADKLDFSAQQKLQLQQLISQEHLSVAKLHQNTQMSDEQKSAGFQQIQAQTKEHFVAMLTSAQQREFRKMTRQ